jgi:transketolase
MTEKTGKLVSMRAAYGQALADYGAVNLDVVVLDADVSVSTQTHFFAKRFPDRFFNLGIAEAGLIDVAVGFALAGKIPFANTFAFLIALRAGEQVRTQVCLNNANVKLCGAYGGLSDSFDGPTHHAALDLAVMRAMPGLTVVVAADAVEARKLVPQVAEFPGPVFFRLSRAEVPVIFDESYQPRIGQGVQLREGSDVTLVGTGILLSRCLEAADALAQEGVSVRVIEIHTLKPIDADILEQAARETGAIVTVEEHTIVGGLGGAVAEVISERRPVPLVRVGLRDTFAGTGPYAELLDHYGMGVADIIAAAKRALTCKR